MRKPIGTTAKAAIATALLSWLFYEADPARILPLLYQTHKGMLLLAFILSLATVGLGALRWQLLLSAIQIRLPFRETCAISFIGYFFNYLLPAKIGGGIARVYYVARFAAGRSIEVTSSILLDCYLAVTALLIVPLATSLFYNPPGQLGSAADLAYIAILAPLLLLLAFALGEPPLYPAPSTANPGTLLCRLQNIHRLSKLQKVF